ncbi:MAG: phosphoribosylamine--glycine ligase [Acidimicrobiia bacterium]|nr:phosphoribosylamine--glycine ligase [Acidimicrobiia bacterium]
MRILLLGGGAREHAIGWKLAHSPNLEVLISAPGNPGLARLGAIVPGFDVTDAEAVADFAVANAIDLVVVGPEAPLAAGVVDALAAAGIDAFGPTKAGAQLEASKAFAKDVMRRANVPTAKAWTFTDVNDAIAHLEASEPPYVIKADGLAAGKGVLVTEDLIAAQSWARLCIDGHFGDAGATVVVEEHLDGEELSVLALCDGTRAVALEPARDYKRLLDGDTGPNTGGMGCYSPVADMPEDIVEHVLDHVIDPVLEVMAEDGIKYKGFLYAGMMLTRTGPKVLEFNCRLGDPETQVILPRLDEDFLELLIAANEGNLPDRQLRFSDTAAVGVVLAAAGYPESPERGVPITGSRELHAEPDVHIFHAGTKLTVDGLVSNGGRVLNVVGRGPDVATARAAAYRAAETVDFPGKQYRSDIAKRAP